MRSHRRGIKEMDIILGRFADQHLTELSQDDLPVYDALLSENDQELYKWVTGQAQAPEQYNALIERITVCARS